MTETEIAQDPRQDFAADLHIASAGCPVASEQTARLRNRIELKSSVPITARLSLRHSRGEEISHAMVESTRIIVATDVTIAAVIAGVFGDSNAEQALTVVQHLAAATAGKIEGDHKIESRQRVR